MPGSLVSAVGAVLSNKDLDGYFAAAAISLPAAAELIGTIPNVDPVLLHNVRCGAIRLHMPQAASRLFHCMYACLWSEGPA